METRCIPYIHFPGFCFDLCAIIEGFIDYFIVRIKDQERANME